MTAGAGIAPWSASFDGGPGTPGLAREGAGVFLATLATQRPPVDPHGFDRAMLVVSELVTNAVRHAPGPVGLVLALAPGDEVTVIRIVVQDTSTVLPAPRVPDLVGGTGGFGWSAIIQPMAVGLRVRPQPDGKQIEVLLPW